MSRNAPILVTASEAAEILAVSLTQVYDLAAEGKLEKRYIGKGTRNFRLTYSSLEKWAAGLSQDPIVEAAS